MERILECPGSAIDNPPDTSSAASEEGTVAHGFGERLLKCLDVEQFPNDEMASAVFDYVGYVRAHKSHAELEGVEQANSAVLIENRIVSELVPDHGGTIDTTIVSYTHLHVIDFKYGVMPVSAQNNKQILSYLALADERYPGRERFFGSIVQPRVFGHPECVEYTKAEIDSHVCDVMLAADDDTKKAGSHCRWCPLRETCHVLEDHNKELATEAFDTGWDAFKCLDVIAMAGVMKTLAEDAKIHLRKLLLDGEEVPGYRLARQLANRCWKDEDAFLDDPKIVGIDDEHLYAPQKLLSPTQMEKSLAKSYGPTIDLHTHRPEKGIIVVEESSRLPIYDPVEAFDDLP